VTGKRVLWFWNQALLVQLSVLEVVLGLQHLLSFRRKDEKKEIKNWHQIGYNFHFSWTPYISLDNLSKPRILIKCLVLFTLVSFTALGLAKMAVILAKAVPWFYKQNGFK